jgi:signal transduction histidine kinase
MDFDARPPRTLLPGTALLVAAAFAVGASYQDGSHRAVFAASGLAALLGLVLIRHGWRAISSTALSPPLERPADVTQDHALLAARALALETQLEFAPIALFRQHDGPANAFEPANANARRLLAPGRATSVAALHHTLSALTAGRRSVIDVETEHGTERALAIVSALTVEGRPQRLVALLPLEDELNAEAMQAWRQLVHVLTHEIMNSLTPVTSLSDSSRELLLEVRGSLPGDIAHDLDIALDAISRRAASLTRFVSGYRTLASVPAAQPQRVNVAAMFGRLSALVTPAWQSRGGAATFEIESVALELMADAGQLEQSLINLIQNAADATVGRDTPQVVISARLTRGGRLRIEVSDNGPGIPDQLVPDIFTPFFTTRSNGSGIGLAMVRQLLHRNGATVRYAKAVGEGARFVVTF